MASSTASIPSAKPPSPQLSDAELQSSFSLLPSVMKLAKALYNGADTQSIHATVSIKILYFVSPQCSINPIVGGTQCSAPEMPSVIRQYSGPIVITSRTRADS